MLTMPKEQFTEIQAREMRIKRRMEQREHERKLRELEKQQEAAREVDEIKALEQAEKDEIARELEHKKTTSKSLLEMENGGYQVKETKELDEEKERKADEKRKKFYDEFKPDFDLDEVPPLE